MKRRNPDDPIQVSFLESILRINPNIKHILDNGDKLALPDWYLGGGCIAQTVWNHLVKRPVTRDIKDYDLVYFDTEDMSEESEHLAAGKTANLFHGLPVKIDVKNEARVHLWYKDHFGYGISPYLSTEDAIASWPTTAASIGVKYKNNKLQICAPFGLDDLFQLVVRPNKRQITREIYDKKVQRWKECWPELQIVPW